VEQQRGFLTVARWYSRGRSSSSERGWAAAAPLVASYLRASMKTSGAYEPSVQSPQRPGDYGRAWYNFHMLGTLRCDPDYSYAETNYANPHAVTSVGGTSYTYDNNGNVTAIGSLDYTWDWRNRLASAEKSAGGFTTYGYDHGGQRVYQATGSATTSYPSRYYNVASSSLTATTTKHIFSPDGTLLATVVGTGTTMASTTYIHADHLGGTNVTTNSSGAVTQTLDYYPYGAQRIASGSSAEQRRFIGEEFDGDTDFSYLNARYYQGSRGQFMSQDPVFVNLGEDKSMLSDPQRLNAYSYGANNPIVLVDSVGLYARNPSTGYVGLKGYGLRILENTFGIGRANAKFFGNLDVILEHPDSDIISGIIYEEQSHGLDDIFLDKTRFGSTVGLGQIKVNDTRSQYGYVSLSRAQLLDPKTNISDISHRISLIGAALNNIGINRSNPNYGAYVGSAYNNQDNFGEISNYGKRVQAYSNDFNSGNNIVPDSLLTVQMILDNLTRFIQSEK
jgi:RHS repeat-associated protein